MRPDITVIQPKVGLLTIADFLAAAVSFTIRFFKAGFAPDDTTPRSEYLAHELDYAGYAPFDPGVFGTSYYDAEAGTAFLDLSQFWLQTQPPSGTDMSVGGWWAESDTGDVFFVTIFDEPIELFPESFYKVGRVRTTMPVPVSDASRATGGAFPPSDTLTLGGGRTPSPPTGGGAGGPSGPGGGPRGGPSGR